LTLQGSPALPWITQTTPLWEFT